MKETWVQSLGWEDPLKKEMATHSSILFWKIPWTEEPGGLQSKGSQRAEHDLAHVLLIFTFKYSFLFVGSLRIFCCLITGSSPLSKEDL